MTASPGSVRGEAGPVVDLGEGRMRLGQLLAGSVPGARAALSAARRESLAAARAIVDRHAAGDAPVYGLNTGLGGNLGHRLGADEVEAFQVRLIRGRCIGVGAPFPEPVARAMLLARLVGLAQGGSGISAPAFEALLALFNAGLTPVVPGRGSIGAGDLGLCAHLAAPAAGLGWVFRAGVRAPAGAALAAAGLAPARLTAKDGLALINGSAVSVGHGAWVAAGLADALLASAAAAALAGEGYAANPAIHDPRLAAARPGAGQARAAALFRAALAGSWLHEPGAPRSIQDALSFRVVAPIYGAALTAFEALRDALETELNAAADSPLVLAAGDMASTANFDTSAIAQAADAMAIAVVPLATAAAGRASKLMDARRSGLPSYLSPVGGASAGLNALQKTMAALHAELRLKAAPASLDSLAVSDGVEDHAPNTPLALRKLDEQTALLGLMTAVEALAASQAIDLRGRPALGAGTRPLFAAMRRVAPMLTEDRETGPDVDAAAAALPEAARAIRAALGDKAFSL